ncbi:hypothetical protein J3R83DRAFT_6211 [Lanmaoa asiatica]|nr:hypothetical protein J3R83DRAFT_6211 [Lanmaoa asiatica]
MAQPTSRARSVQKRGRRRPRKSALATCSGAEAFTWQIDLNLASSLVAIDLSWRHVIDLCGKSVSAYRGLKGVLEQDIDHVSKLLSELDPLVGETEDHSETASDEPRGSPSIEPVFTPQGLHSTDPVNPERRKRKRRRSSIPTSLCFSCKQQELVIIRPTDTFAPTIIITPCQPQSRETSCWVPYQDACFGTRLTLPPYAALNSVHPPMVAPTNTVVMQIDDWEYTRGHWRAERNVLEDDASTTKNPVPAFSDR